jgi:ADP-ribosylglycohydrolase
MIGSIIGDIAGAPYEGDRLVQDKRDYRPFFLNGLAKYTDDTNLTIALADSILTNVPFEQKLLEWYKKNPELGYGSSFKEWAGKGGGYQNESRGNGAAMRVSSIPLFANRIHTSSTGLAQFEERLEWALKKAVESTLPTHNCAEARNGAMSVVATMMLAGYRQNGERVYTKDNIREIVSKLSGYDLTASIEEVREKWSKRDIRCDITVPQAIICFLNGMNFEDTIRLSVYSKGDVDTIAAIAGGMAEQFYGVESINPGILVETRMRLQPEMAAIVNACYDNTLKW